MSSTTSGSKGGDWTGHLRFWNGQQWLPVPDDKVLLFFRNVLEAEEEIIIFSEIRKYDLWWWLPGWFGNWHEYTLVETDNWYWSFEKMTEGIYVQRSKKKDDVRCKFGADNRSKDRSDSEGRSTFVFNGENIINVAEWIINRNELGNKYHVAQRNCQHFASLLYEAITRTVRGRRLSTTF